MPEPTATDTTNQAAAIPKATAAKVAPTRAEIIAQVDAEKASSKPQEKPVPKAQAKAAPAATEAPSDAVDSTEATKEPEANQSKVAVIMRAKRQAQAIREQAEARVAQERQAWEAEKASLTAKQREFAETQALLSDNPIEALKKLGLDPRKFFSKALEKEKDLDPVEMTRQELAALKAELRAEREAAQRANEEQAKKASESVRTESQKHFIRHAATNAEKYQAIDVAFSHAPQALATLAEEVADAYHKKTGEYASFDDICEYLNNEHASTAKARSMLEKLQKPGAEPTAGRANALTLGSDAASVETGPATDVKKMTPAERRLYIIKSVEQESQERLSNRKR